VQKVDVFVDYENTYRGARRAFFKETDPPTLGHIDPLKLGQFIALIAVLMLFAAATAASLPRPVASPSETLRSLRAEVQP
jgi:hypothetical protein